VYESLDVSLVLSFEPAALERCFLVAELLDAQCGRPIEYGLLGLASPTRPFHVVATPLLCGQEGTETTVRQSGRAVLQMHREIETLAEQLACRLMPIVFVHRHPGSCHISDTDDEFLTTTFIDQVSAAAFSLGMESVAAEPSLRAVLQPSASRPGCAHLRTNEVEPEVGVTCFGLIVNRFRQYCLYAVYREFCPLCRGSRVGYVPCRLAVRPDRPLADDEQQSLRPALEIEMQEKISVVARIAENGVCD